jgi:hypothetical protein
MNNHTVDLTTYKQVNINGTVFLTKMGAFTDTVNIQHIHTVKKPNSNCGASAVCAVLR